MSWSGTGNECWSSFPISQLLAISGLGNDIGEERIEKICQNVVEKHLVVFIGFIKESNSLLTRKNVLDVMICSIAFCCDEFNKNCQDLIIQSFTPHDTLQILANTYFVKNPLEKIEGHVASHFDLFIALRGFEDLSFDMVYRFFWHHRVNSSFNELFGDYICRVVKKFGSYSMVILLNVDMSMLPIEFFIKLLAIPNINVNLIMHKIVDLLEYFSEGKKQNELALSQFKLSTNTNESLIKTFHTSEINYTKKIEELEMAKKRRLELHEIMTEEENSEKLLTNEVNKIYLEIEQISKSIHVETKKEDMLQQEIKINDENLIQAQKIISQKPNKETSEDSTIISKLKQSLFDSTRQKIYSIDVKDVHNSLQNNIQHIYKFIEPPSTIPDLSPYFFKTQHFEYLWNSVTENSTKACTLYASYLAIMGDDCDDLSMNLLIQSSERGDLYAKHNLAMMIMLQRGQHMDIGDASKLLVETVEYGFLPSVELMREFGIELKSI